MRSVVPEPTSLRKSSPHHLQMFAWSAACKYMYHATCNIMSLHYMKDCRRSVHWLMLITEYGNTNEQSMAILHALRHVMELYLPLQDVCKVSLYKIQTQAKSSLHTRTNTNNGMSVVMCMLTCVVYMCLTMCTCTCTCMCVFLKTRRTLLNVCFTPQLITYTVTCTCSTVCTCMWPA